MGKATKPPKKGKEEGVGQWQFADSRISPPASRKSSSFSSERSPSRRHSAASVTLEDDGHRRQKRASSCTANMWVATRDCRELVDLNDSLLEARTTALFRGELDGLGPPDLCCVYKVPQERRLPRLFSRPTDDPQQDRPVPFCHFVVGVDISQPAPIAAYLCLLLSTQEQPTGWFRRGWRVVRCLYCAYNALHQQDLRVELRCEGAAPRRVEVRLLEASGEQQEGPSISQTSWGALALCGLLRTELPPQVPCLRVFRGPLEVPCCGQGGPPADGSRLLMDLFEKHAGEGDLLGLLPSTGRGTNAMCEVLASHLLRSPSLLPCVETLASLQGASPLMPLHISRAYARRGQLEQALSPLLRCLSAYPEEACLLRQLAELLLRGGLCEQAAKAAAFAVELCPTVQRYWLSLARAEIACGRFAEALIVLNAAPAVCVSAPFYSAGLPANIKTLSTTQPRQRGCGFYSFLWLTPVDPALLPFTSREEGELPTAAAASAAAALLRSPTVALEASKRDSIRRSVSSCSLSFTPPLRSAVSPKPPRDAGARRLKGGPLRKQLPLGEQEGARKGGGAFHYGGLGGAPFGLARGLDEATLLRRHWELLHKEKRMHAGAESGLLGSSEEWSSGPLDHLQIARRMRMLKLDLSERRRYAVLVSLYKRVGLDALRLLVKKVFLPDSTETAVSGGPSGRALGPPAAAGPPTATGTPREGPLQESPPSCCSFSREPEAADMVLRAPAGSEQGEGAPSLLSRGPPPVGLAQLAAKEEAPLLVSRTQDDLDEVVPQEKKPPFSLRPPPSLSSPAAVSPSPLRAPAAGQEQRQSLGVEETLGLSAGKERASSSEGERAPINEDRGFSPDAAQELAREEVQDPLFRDEQMLGSDEGRFSAAVPRRLTSSLAALLAGLEEDAAFFSKTTEALPWPHLSGDPLEGEGGPETPRSEGDSPSMKELAAYWLFRGALCERLHEWTEMEVAYRVAVTQGVSPLALRGLLRLYIRLGLSVEALRIANIAANQFSSLCKTPVLPFLPAWLVAQLTRLIQR
ncbi:hypothetical protein Esti_001558 [Eimeria stiedai]